MRSRHLAELGATPRFIGTEGNARARSYCTSTLRSLGYGVEERSFTFSAFAGLHGAQLLGLWFGATFAVSWWLGVSRWALHAVMLSMLLASVSARFLSPGRGPRGRWARTGVNLVAWRGPAVPRVWVVAHIDSKWQPISILLRAGAITLAATCLGAVVLLVFMGRFTFDYLPALPVAYAIGALAVLPLLLSVVGDGSDGAADNASGVAAVLAAAEKLAGEDGVGIAITDGEELALAGAHALAPQLGRRGVVLNCDTIDDEGRFTVMKVRGASHRTIDAMRTALSEAGAPVRVMRLLPGILTDSVAFAAAGHDSVTLSRGTLSTLGRLHTSRDTLARVRGTAIETAGASLANAARRLV